MTYKEWANTEDIRRGELVARLKGLGKTTKEISDYFDFDNMKIMEPNYCELYKTNTKCHNMEKLNCFFCGCPYFVYNDEGLEVIDGVIIYSKCSIDDILGNQIETIDGLHHDCSKCCIPHHQAFVNRMSRKYIEEVT